MRKIALILAAAGLTATLWAQAPHTALRPEQTILLCTTSEIRKDSDYIKLEPFISKTYTLKRDVEKQCTDVMDGYFGIQLNND